MSDPPTTSGKRKSPNSRQSMETRRRSKRAKDKGDKTEHSSDAETLSDITPPPSTDIAVSGVTKVVHGDSVVEKGKQTAETDNQWEVLEPNADSSNTTTDKNTAKEAKTIVSPTALSTLKTPPRQYPLGRPPSSNDAGQDKRQDFEQRARVVAAEEAPDPLGATKTSETAHLTAEAKVGSNDQQEGEDSIPDLEGSPSWGSLDDDPLQESAVEKEVTIMRNTLRRAVESHGMISELITLTNTGPNSSVIPVPLFNIVPEFSDVATLRRVFAISGSPSNDVLFNIATADPSKFENTGGYIRSKDTNCIAEFFLIGSVTLSALSGGQTDRNRQVCARLLWETYPRAAAFIGKTLGKRSLFVPSFKAGVSFSTMMPRDVSRSSQGNSHHPKSAAPAPTQSTSSYLNAVQPAIPSGVDVPVFDGRHKRFRLGYFEGQLEPYDGEINEDSLALIVFTVGTFVIPDYKRPNSAGVAISESLSLNVKSVVVIADPEQEYTGAALPGEALWGVEIQTAPPRPTLDSLGDAL